MEKKRKIRTAVLITLLVAVLAASGYYLWQEMTSQSREKKDFDRIQQLVDDGENGRNLALLMAQNSDCIGWVCIPKTTLDYPVMHTPDNSQKYLRLNFDGEYSFSGVPFLDARCNLDSDNLVIYGHNLKNDTMFSSLGGYAQSSYCKKHPKIEFETADGLSTYSVFAVAQIDENDDWYDFIDAPNSKSFNDCIDRITQKALYTTDVVPEFGQQLLTLTTCYGSSKTDRLIVISVKDSE